MDKLDKTDCLNILLIGYKSLLGPDTGVVVEYDNEKWVVWRNLLNNEIVISPICTGVKAGIMIKVNDNSRLEN